MQQVESGTPLARSNSFDREHEDSGSSDYSVEPPTFSSQTQADLFSGAGEEDVLSETGGMPRDLDSLNIQNAAIPPGRSDGSTPLPPHRREKRCCSEAFCGSVATMDDDSKAES